ncbi:MAG: hypothetical protein ABIT76_00120 [Chthoniobacterales bacterium]
MQFQLPNAAPFDAANWFETFVGQIVVPLLSTGKVKRYWFTRYETGGNKSALFRFYTRDVKAIEKKAKELAKSMHVTGGAADLAYDAGEISGHPRFLGTNQRQADGKARKELIWDFLHASAVLYVDCLSHQDGQGRWNSEINMDQGNCSTGQTFESFHHMFCNITGFDPQIYYFQDPALQGFLSPMYYVARFEKQIEANIAANKPPMDGLPIPARAFRVKF